MKKPGDIPKLDVQELRVAPETVQVLTVFETPLATYMKPSLVASPMGAVNPTPPEFAQP